MKKNMHFKNKLLIACFTTLSVLGSANELPIIKELIKERTPQEQLERIQVQEGYEIKLAASEPMVVEPTIAGFDGNGNMYVFEWLSYMQNIKDTMHKDAISRISLLKDTNNDGVFDQKTIFVDKVVCPRMLLVLHDRILVNFSWDSTIYSFRDTDGDGVADQKEIALAGEPHGGNLEHMESGMVWNRDNIIDAKYNRYKYKNGKLQIVGPGIQTQWGLSHDDSGRPYGTFAGGGIPAKGFQIPAAYKQLIVKEELEQGFKDVYGNNIIPDYTSHGTRNGFDRSDETIWKDTLSGGRKNQLQNFSASVGINIYRGHAMKELYGDAIIPDPVGRLVRRGKHELVDGIRVLRNPYPQNEFIRSDDPYFRPVQALTGPDGSIYILDMYRGIVQEKNWFWETGPRYHLVKQLGMQNVVRNGRIWRVSPKGFKPGVQPDLLDRQPKDLVPVLAHESGWWRDMAQRILVAREDTEVIPALKQMIKTTGSEQARMHALWTLDGLGGAEVDILLESFKDSSAIVRAAAVQISEPLLKDHPDLLNALDSLIDDTNNDVKVQVYLSRSTVFPNQSKRHMADLRKFSPDNRLVDYLEIADQQRKKEASMAVQEKKGQVFYNQLCMACHGTNGEGMMQDGKLLAPDLTRSKRVSGNPEFLTALVLKGLTGAIDGKTYGDGLMLPLETYSDEKIADVLTYIRRNWKSKRKPDSISAEQVSKVRKMVTERKTPWTMEELKKHMKNI